MRRTVTLALILLLSAACVSRTVGTSEMAAVAPMLSVERFLQAASSRDLEAMGRIFGTVDGPMADTGSTIGCAFKKIGSWIGLGRRCITEEEVELRMNAIAEILSHRDYRIVSEDPVPGRRQAARRIGVDLVFRDTTVSNVPFTVVQGPEARWLVEQIDLVRVTQR